VDASGEDLGIDFLQSGVVEDLGGVDPFLELGCVVVLELVLQELVQVSVFGVLAGCGEQGGAVKLEACDLLREVAKSPEDAIEVVDDPGIAPRDGLHVPESLFLVHRSTPFVLFFGGRGSSPPLPQSSRLSGVGQPLFAVLALPG